jgi:cytochrome c553
MTHRISITVWAALALFWSGTILAAPPYLGVQPQGDAGKAQSIVKNTCSACHGMHGNSVSSGFPNLAGQNYGYLLKQLEDFDGMVGALPKSQRDQDFENLATYFSAQKLDRQVNANANTQPAPRAALEAGYRIYSQGIRAENVPACAACHMPSGAGMAPMAIPVLAGQHASYVESQLKGFADGSRDNSPSHIMGYIAQRLDAQQIKDVALYVQMLRQELTVGSGPKTYSAYVKSVSSEPVPGVPASAVSSSKGQSSGSSSAASQGSSSQ